MLRQWQHVAGLGIGIAGMSFAATFGEPVLAFFAYAMAAGLGIVVYVQGDRYAAAGTVAGNVLIGFLGGVILSLATATGLLNWFLGIPPDFGAWQVGLLMWDTWAGVGAAVLSGFFIAGITAAFG